MTEKIIKLIVGAAVEGSALVVSSTYRFYCLFFKLLKSEDLNTCVFWCTRYLGAGPSSCLLPRSGFWCLTNTFSPLHAAVQNLFALNVHSTAGNSWPAVISVPLCLVWLEMKWQVFLYQLLPTSKQFWYDSSALVAVLLIGWWKHEKTLKTPK